MNKQCNRCEQVFPATTDHFHKNGDRLKSLCKLCVKAYHKNHHEQKYKGNPEYRASRREYEQANKSSINESRRANYHANIESKRAYHRQHRIENPEWYKEYFTEYYKDPVKRLRKTMSRAMWGCLAGREKSSSTFDYIGCTIEELWDHLESQFTEGMTRDNYGEWHVDHIKPIASFDFDSDLESELHKAWHYSNLQPLWAKDNLSKGKKERMNG